jgi:hypothetical protein
MFTSINCDTCLRADKFSIKANVISQIGGFPEAQQYGRRAGRIVYQLQRKLAGGMMSIDVAQNAMFELDVATIMASLVAYTGKAPTLSMPASGRVTHDLRAFAYTLGDFAMRGYAGIGLPPVAAIVTGPSVGVHTVESGDVCIDTGVCNTADEMATLSVVAAASGCGSVRNLTSRIPVGGAVLAGDELTSYCVRLLHVVMAGEAAAGRGAHTLFAFARGMACHLTLRSHCDEGGFTRKCFDSAVYAPACGYLSNREQEFNGISTHVKLTMKRTAEAMLSYYFAAVLAVVQGRRAMDGDRGTRNVIPVMCTTNKKGEHAADDFSGMVEEVDRIFASAADRLCNYINVAASNREEVGIIRMNVLSHPDAHLKCKIVCPGAWVEPAGITPKHVILSVGPALASQKTVRLPMFDTGEVLTSGDGTFVTSIVEVNLTNTSARYWGASYFFEDRYHLSSGMAPGGLGYWRQVRRRDVKSTWLSMAAQQASLQNTRWKLPHSWLPSDFEQHCVDSCAHIRLEYTAENIMQLPQVSEWKSAFVDVTISPLVVCDSFDDDIETHRSHPEWYSRHYSRMMRVVAPEMRELPPLTLRVRLGWCCGGSDMPAADEDVELLTTPDKLGEDEDDGAGGVVVPQHTSSSSASAAAASRAQGEADNTRYAVPVQKIDLLAVARSATTEATRAEAAAEAEKRRLELAAKISRERAAHDEVLRAERQETARERGLTAITIEAARSFTTATTETEARRLITALAEARSSDIGTMSDDEVSSAITRARDVRAAADAAAHAKNKPKPK